MTAALHLTSEPPSGRASRTLPPRRPAAPRCHAARRRPVQQSTVSGSGAWRGLSAPRRLGAPAAPGLHRHLRRSDRHRSLHRPCSLRPRRALHTAPLPSRPRSPSPPLPGPVTRVPRCGAASGRVSRTLPPRPLAAPRCHAAPRRSVRRLALGSGAWRGLSAPRPRVRRRRLPVRLAPPCHRRALPLARSRSLLRRSTGGDMYSLGRSKQGLASEPGRSC